MRCLTTRVLTHDEVGAFDVEPYEINWGVLLNDVPVACCRAEIDGAGGLWVHANVHRHTLRPRETAAYAKAFCERLLKYGFKRLRTQVDSGNRTALRLVRVLGFVEIERNDQDVVLNYGRINEETAV